MKHLYFMVTVSMVMFLSTIHAAVIHVPADYPTIQEGIDAAFDGDTVLVAAGTYTGHGNRDIELFSKAIMVQGSGPATCVINCENADYGFYFHHGELDTTIVSGFTIRASSFNGIRCYQSSPLIENCRIEDCHDGIICIHSSVTIRNCVINTPGTGFHCSYGRPLLEDCVMTNGTSSGVDLWYSRARMTRCTVSNNSNDLGGAGIKNWKSSLIMSHCLVENNELYGTDVLYGAGVFSVGDNLEMRHCVIRNNTIHSDPPYYEHGEGAGLFIQSNAQIENCLIRGNIAENGAVGGVYCGSPDYVTIQCCTIADNQGFGFDAGSSFSRFWSCIIWDECGLGANGEISYSNMLNPVSGIGIISEDPLFVSGPDGEYYLSQIDSGQGSQSPCVDAGANYAFEYRFGDLTMAQLTTRTDQIVDSGIIDLGYHYPAETMSPTPTQTPTQTPTCFPTSTPDPTPTPTAFGLGVDLVISQEMFTPGDDFLLQAIVSNPGPDTYGGIPLVVVMELYDTYFWYPTWSTEFTANFIDLSIGIFSMDIVDVTWPEMPGSGSSARIYGALLNEGFSSILGQWDMVAFGW